MDKHVHNDDAINFLNPVSGYTVAYWQANQTALDAGPNFNIDDTAAHIQAALNGLSADSHISQIVITDNASIVLTAAKLTSDAAALGKLINGDNSPATLTVKDTALHIGNNFATIGTSAQVTSVVISDNGIVTITASQMSNNQNVLGELVNANASAVNVTLKDSAAHIQASGILDVASAHLSTITSIVVSNSAVMTLTAGQIANDAAALAEVTNNNGNPVTFKVSDTGANIGANLDALQANTQITTITDSDNSAIDLSIAQFTSDAGALGKIVNANAGTVSFHVGDTAANISSDFDSLNNSSNVTRITVTDSATNEVTITASQAASDTAALNELFKADGTTAAKVAVSDTAANISGALDSLNSNTHVDKIVISDSNPLALSAGQVASDTTALGEISGSYSIHVTGTAADVTTNLDALQGNGHVTGIVISNSLEITVSVTQLSNDAAVIADITNQDASPVHVIVADSAGVIEAQIGALNGNALVNKIIVTDSATHEVTVSVAQVGADSTVLGELFQADGTTPAQFAVNDTAANIAGAIDALNANSHIDRIIVSNSGSAEVTITAAQAAADSVALGHIYQADGITHDDVAVSDTAANISGAFGALNGNTNVDKIIVSDSGSNEVTITAAQAANDTIALGELRNSDGSTGHVAVSDSAGNISVAFDALNANTHVNKIIVSDGNEVTITAAQAASDTAALGELFQADGTTAAHVAVSDTASAISGAFDALNANSLVDKIIVSDSATHEVTISVAQAANDTAALSELVVADGTTPAHVAVADTASAISGAFDALNANSHVNTIIVSDGSGEVTITAAQAASDTAALNELVISNGEGAHVAVSDSASAISAAFDALNGNSHVNKIIVDNGPAHAPTLVTEVTISVAQLASDTTALAELVQTDGVTQAHVAISDTAANISTAFDTLNGNTQVDHIIINDSSPLTLFASQVINDTRALGEISGGYTIAVNDTAADITANLDALQANTHVTAIVVSDNAEITVSVAQLTSDAAVIGELSNADTSTVHVIVSDTAADISAAFDALNGNGVVNKIVVSDSATHEVAITVAQVNSDFTALNELVAANGISEVLVAVSDSAANITSALDSLNGNTRVDKIIVSDSATNEVTITVAQLASDTNALGELYKADGTTLATVAVLDTAANISAALNTLEGSGRMDKVIVSDSATHEIVASVAQLTSDAGVLANLYNADGTTAAHVTVSDSASNISGDLDALNSDAQVDHIIISDNGAITVTVAQATGDATAIGELQNQNGGPVSLTVQDTAAAISAALDTLNSETNISSIVISDNAALTLTAGQITSDASALAKLSDLDSSGVTINVVDTAAHISANLEALQANNDIVSITVSDSAPITVTVAQITSDAVVLSELQNADHSPVLLTVDDTAANIRANLASLNQNTDITSIVISDNAVLLLTVAQLNTDAHALSILQNANGNPYALRISDTAAHVSGALDALSANTAHVKTIVVTDSAAIVLNIAQITSDAHALGEMVNSNGTPYALSVHDSAANISTSFDALNNNSHVGQIVVSDSATHEVLISAGQFASDITALAELFQADGTTLAHVNVADTAANVTTALNSLVSTQADKITVTDSGSNEVRVSVAQITSDAAALVKLFDANGSTPANVAVSDSASDITAALDTLNGNSQVNKIIVSDSATNEVTVSVAQISSDAHALAELYVADGTIHAKVAVNDTAAAITTALDALSANSSLVNKIVVSDSATNEVTVSIAQITSDATALAELFNSDGTTHANVVVNDTAAAISSAFDALGTDGQVNKIIVSDSATNEVTLLAAQIANDTQALAELYNVDGTTLANVKVVDTAANISSAFDALNSDSLNNGSQLNKIVITDSGGNEVTITAAQAHNDTAALNELFNSGGTTLAHVAVSDTAANISVALGQLNVNTHVDHIFISDGNALTLSTSQVIHDTTALGEIVGPYTIDVNDTAAHITANLDALEANASVTQIIVSDNKDIVVSIAQLTSDANVLSVTMDADGLSPAALKIVDTAANIQANLGNLEADGFNHYIDVIVVSDNGAITLSASQLNIDPDVLLALRNANGTKVSLTMADTSGQIQAVLDEIQEYNNFSVFSQFTSIIVTNNGQMTITAAQVHNDASVLGEIQNRNGSPVTFKVVDTAANISTYLNDLQANGHLSTIVISDNAAIGVSIAQLTSDSAAIALLHNQNNTTYQLDVTDTAAHIQAAIASLNSHSHLDKIIVSDSATHEVDFTAFQLTYDTTMLGKLYDADGVTHASIELVDAAGHIQALTAAQFQAMASEGVTQIDSSNNKLLLQVAQYEGLGTVVLTQADVVTLSDTGAAISGMTATQLGALAANGIDKLVVTDHALTLGVDQWNALSVAVDAATTVTINGTSGNDSLTTNAGNFVVNGGGGADSFTLGTGHHDQFVYTAVSDSTGTNFDTIHNFNSQVDSFNFNFAVTAIDTAVHSGALDSGANFDTELAADIGAGQLGSHHAVLFTATSGTLAGHTFLIVDANGVAGYQAGQDYVIDVTGGQHLGTLSTANFFDH